MFHMIERSQALLLITTILLALGGYHLLILFEFLPSSYVWHGKIDSAESLYWHESVSLVLIALALTALVLDSLNIAQNITRNVFAGFALLFAFNTVINLFAPTWIEQLLFTVLTLIMSLLMYRLSIRDEQSHEAI